MQPDKPEMKNLVIAMLISVVILVVWQLMVINPKLEEQKKHQATLAKTAVEAAPEASEALSPPSGTVFRDRHEILAGQAGERLPIRSDTLHGSINLRGARLDDLTLADYHQAPDPTSEEVVLLAPAGTTAPYFGEFGWLPGDTGGKTPNYKTEWQTDAKALAPGAPVTLFWDNGEGQRFETVLSLDEHYLLTVEKRVINEGDAPVSLVPYGQVNRILPAPREESPLLHEGPIGVFQGELQEVGYNELAEDGLKAFAGQGNWMGITDKYWLTALVPDPAYSYTSQFRFRPEKGTAQRFQVDFTAQPVTVQPGETIQLTHHFFAGAKKVDLLDAYSEELRLPLFDRAVDFGVLYILTKPIYYALIWFKAFLGNFGLAIMALTVVIKLFFFPVANKGYASMAAMRRLAPKIKEVREKHKENPLAMNQEIMEIYRREKINPLAGCLPIVVQIPVFFALYKVLLITIDMRHAPFYGWITDLSAKDPTNIFTLFGLLPFDTPGFLHIGAWPVIMALSMFIQQKLNPAPPDPMQARIMSLLPLMFLFFFANFPAGLVIYWAWNNILSILQQLLIMKRHGALGKS